VFVAAPHQYVQPRAGDQELTWTPLQQVIGSTYVWFAVLLFVLLWAAWRSRPADERAATAL
jgi:alpha-1,2-mannosyltransferase